MVACVEVGLTVSAIVSSARATLAQVTAIAVGPCSSAVAFAATRSAAAAGSTASAVPSARLAPQPVDDTLYARALDVGEPLDVGQRPDLVTRVADDGGGYKMLRGVLQ
jgi:hypothetical protein